MLAAWSDLVVRMSKDDDHGRVGPAHRRLARDARRNFPGTRYELRRHGPLILMAVLATQDRKERDELEQRLPRL